MIKEQHATGSRYICNPAPMDTDNDTIVLLEPGTFENWFTGMLVDGWQMGGSEHPDNIWWSLRKDQENYIVTESEDLYRNFVLATKVAKKLNLLNKPDRVMLFEAFCEGQFEEVEVVPF